MKHLVKALFYIILVLFTFNRLQLYYRYLLTFRREYYSDIYAYNEICRNIVKLNDMGRNANFCNNIDIRIAQGPYIRAFEKLYSESTGCGDINCFETVVGPIINNSNFLIFFTLVCVFLYVISKFVPFFTYFFKSENNNRSVQLLNYNFDNINDQYRPFVYSQGNRRFVIENSRSGFIPALETPVIEKIKYS